MKEIFCTWTLWTVPKDFYWCKNWIFFFFLKNGGGGRNEAVDREMHFETIFEILNKYLGLCNKKIDPFLQMADFDTLNDDTLNDDLFTKWFNS